MPQENSPKISIVMPAYNRSAVIAHAIRSVIDQTFTDWELIIVDDGSEDGTKRIVDNFAHPRIIYKKIEHCGFVSKVRNEGNKMARGELIVVHDSDDVAFPDRLEEIWNAYQEHPKGDLFYHGFYQRFFDPYNNALIRKVRPALPYNKEKLLQEQYIPGQVAYKRETVLRIPYDERIRCCDDYQILLEFALNDCVFIPIYKNLYEYADSPDSINVFGEADGSRKRDVEIILKILKEKYGRESSAMMVKNTVSDGNKLGELISRDFIFGKNI